MFNSVTIEDFDGFPEFAVGSSVSTRVVMGKVLDWAGIHMPSLMGGSADLSSSTQVKGANGIFSKSNAIGRNI